MFHCFIQLLQLKDPSCRYIIPLRSQTFLSSPSNAVESTLSARLQSTQSSARHKREPHSAMATGNGFKKEQSVAIKPEPRADDTLMEDDDDYDDTGELQFPKELPETWLVRVPKDLWSAIDKSKMDDEIKLGEVLVWTKPNSTVPNKVTTHPAANCFVHCTDYASIGQMENQR